MLRKRECEQERERGPKGNLREREKGEKKRRAAGLEKSAPSPAQSSPMTSRMRLAASESARAAVMKCEAMQREIKRHLHREFTIQIALAR